jgi:hypothetical protein
MQQPALPASRVPQGERVSKPLTLAEIIGKARALEAPEAVALVLAIAGESRKTSGTWRALSSAQNILLGPSGRVSIAEEGDAVREGDRVKMLAALLKSLLGVDRAEHRPHAPGGLLVLIAR